MLYGARLSLLVGRISQSVAVTLGVLLGLVAGYYQRWVDATVMRLADVTLAFPTRVLWRHLLPNVQARVMRGER